MALLGRMFRFSRGANAKLGISEPDSSGVGGGNTVALLGSMLGVSPGAKTRLGVSRSTIRGIPCPENKVGSGTW